MHIPFAIFNQCIGIFLKSIVVFQIGSAGDRRKASVIDNEAYLNSYLDQRRLVALGELSQLFSGGVGSVFSDAKIYRYIQLLWLRLFSTDVSASAWQHREAEGCTTLKPPPTYLQLVLAHMPSLPHSRLNQSSIIFLKIKWTFRRRWRSSL